MYPNYHGLNDEEDLDEIFNLSSVVGPEYVYRNYRSSKDQSKDAAINVGRQGITICQNSGTTDSQTIHADSRSDTDSQFINLLQESLHKSLRDCNSNDSALVESQSTTSTTNQTVGSFSNLSYHSLLRRNIIDQALTPMDQQNEDVDTLPTLDNPIFSPFFQNTQASFYSTSINDNIQQSFGSFSNPSFNSLLRRNIIDQAMTPMNQQNEDLRTLPTLDNPVFSPFFRDTQASYRSTSINEDRQLYAEDSQPFARQTNMIELIDSRIDQSQDSNNPHSLLTTKKPSPFHLSSQRPWNQQQYNSPTILHSNIFGSYRPSEHIAANMSSIPKSILNLYKQIKESGSSDWAFIHALSAQTCQEFTPMNCYFMLKTCLLLSIASINSESDRVPIPIIAIGKDCSSADSIMNHIGNFAQRLLAPTDQIFNVSMNSDKFVEVGHVFLAKNGVCYLGNWSGLTKSQSEEIQIIISSGRFFLDKSSENFKLGSAIWTHWSSTNSNKDRSTVAMFLRYFGIPIVMDADHSDTIIEFILEEAMNGQVDIPDDVLDICYEDMKSYLNIIRKIDVETSKSAQILIKSYSDAIKLDREDALSPRGLEIIQQMSESHAKMCLRDTVLNIDVIAVIAIFEKTVRGMMGVNISGVSPAPILLNVLCIEEVDDYMKKFETWLYDYLRMFKQSTT